MSQANPSDKEVDDYAQAWMANGNKIKAAWKIAFPNSKATEKSKDEKSSLFHKLDKVRSRVGELTDIAAEKADEVYGITAESLIRDLGEIKDKALSEGQFSPSVSAVMGQAKLCGFDVTKVEVTATITHEQWLEKLE